MVILYAFISHPKVVCGSDLLNLVDRHESPSYWNRFLHCSDFPQSENTSRHYSRKAIKDRLDVRCSFLSLSSVLFYLSVYIVEMLL